MQLGIFPLGMDWTEAEFRIRRNWVSPALQEEGLSHWANSSSESRSNSTQSALRKLVKVTLGRSGMLLESDPPR